ncbi:hypothetical protein Tco_1022844 [Tanacetum coccineum]
MSQRWRTFASISNKCLLGKLEIDNRQTTAARRSNMPYLRQVYGKTIPDVMVSKEIIGTTAYKTYLAFATGKAIHKKARKRTKVATITIKESSLNVDDNIISKDPNVALKLAKSMRKTKAEEQEAARLVHETHERIVTEKPTKRRRQIGVVFRETPTVSKKKPLDQSQKLKSVQVMSEEERLATNTKKAIKASKLATVPQQTTGSSEGAGLIPEGNDNDTEKSNKEEVPWIYSDDDKDDDNDGDQRIDLEETHDEVNKHDNDETQRDNNKDQAMDDAEKNDEDKSEEEKDTNQENIQDEQAKDEVAGVLLSIIHKEKHNLSIFTSSKSVSSNYGNKFLISSPERSLLGTVKESTDAEITSMIDVQI